MSDWVKIKPTTVNIQQLLKRNPKHNCCKMVIKKSKKNNLYTGLYCREHDHLLMWINDEQKEWLIALGVDAIFKNTKSVLTNGT